MSMVNLIQFVANKNLFSQSHSLKSQNCIYIYKKSLQIIVQSNSFLLFKTNIFLKILEIFDHFAKYSNQNC